MAGKSRERVISSVLTGAIGVGAVVLLHSRTSLFSRDPGPPDPSGPEYVSGWQRFLTAGIQTGNPSAPVQLVEFIDMQCPSCRLLDPTVQSLREQFGDDLAVTYVMYPLPYHRYAEPAARAAVCAHQQGRGGEFVHAVYANPEALSRQAWGEYGDLAGVPDRDQLEGCARDTAEVALIKAGKALGDSLDIVGTPTLVVNGWRFESGALPERYLFGFIRDLRRGNLPGDTTQYTTPLMPTVDTTEEVAVFRHERSALAVAPRLRLSYNPLSIVRADPERPEFDLTFVDHIAVLADGTLFVAARSPKGSLLSFSPDGRPVRVVATQGEGPGSFRRVDGLAVTSDDHVLMVDIASNRLTEFDSDGQLVRTRTFLLDGPSPDLFGASLVGFLSDGSAVLSTAAVAGPGEVDEDGRLRARMYRVDASGRRSVLMAVPGLEMATVASEYRDGPRTMRMPKRFSRNVWVSVVGAMLVFSDGTVHGFTTWTGAGMGGTRTIMAGQRRAVTPEMVARAVEAELATYEVPMTEKPRDLDASRRQVRTRPVADSLPAVDRLFAYPGGIIWLVDGQSPLDSTWSASAFTVDGVLRGRLTSPPGKPLPFFMQDSLVGFVTEDRQGFKQIWLYGVLGLDRN